jgi:hypothetical protein
VRKLPAASGPNLLGHWLFENLKKERFQVVGLVFFVLFLTIAM